MTVSDTTTSLRYVVGFLVPRLCGLAATGLFALAAGTAWLRRHHLDPLRARG